jgi:hypothetical protein
MAGQEPRYWDVVEPIFESVSRFDSPEAFLASIAKVPRSVALVYAAHFCLSEIHNGGFLQFFWNSTGVLAPEALEGFGVIGMPELASVARQAMTLLGDPYPRNRNERWNALLRASPFSHVELGRIFEETGNFYLAYAKATEPLKLDDLDRRAQDLAASENGDFGNAATRYLVELGLLERQ